MQTSKADERHIVAVIRSQAPHRDKVQELLLQFVGPARNEDGCLYFDLFQKADEPDTFYITEGWATEAGVAQHLVQPYVAPILEQVVPLLASPLEITTNTRISDSK